MEVGERNVQIQVLLGMKNNRITENTTALSNKSRVINQECTITRTKSRK